MNVLHVRDLNVFFEGDDTPTVKNINFSIKQGEVVALVGESGAGKSLSARSILNLLPIGASAKGEIIFEDKNLLKLSTKEMQKLRGNKISMVFQDPLAALNPLHKVGKQVLEAILVHSDITKEEAEKRVIELFELVKIDNAKERLNSYPHQLSGGQRQRVMLAMSLANNPKLLILDEPTTALDATVQYEILELLKSLKKKLNMSILIISHDLAMVRFLADFVHVMLKGEIIESGDTKSIFLNPKEVYTKELLGRDINKREPLHAKSKTVLEVKNLNVFYERQRVKLFSKPKPFEAARNISFSLRSKECLGIVGESGSGKSSLALALLRLIPSSGIILFCENELQNLSHKEMRVFRKKIQVVFQDPFASLNPRMSVAEIIKEGLVIQNLQKDENKREEALKSALDEVGLSYEFATRFPHELSGGERQRVAIARALILKPEILILDEPTSSLDRTLQFKVIELLKNLQEKHDMSCIYISHDLYLVKQFCHSVFVMKNGKMVEYASSGEIFENPKTEYLQKLIKASNMQKD
ncbi:MAG: dipeptide ABC transporter ATP-binding protein [Campylobacteraceae bacterium]